VASKCKRGKTDLWKHRSAFWETKNPKARKVLKERKGRKQAIRFPGFEKQQKYSEAHENHESGYLVLATKLNQPGKA